MALTPGCCEIKSALTRPRSASLGANPMVPGEERGRVEVVLVWRVDGSAGQFGGRRYRGVSTRSRSRSLTPGILPAAA